MFETLKKLFNGEDLTLAESLKLFEKMMKGELDSEIISAVLIALRLKGETATEIFAAAKILNEFKLLFEHKRRPCIDTCGTGGDGKNCVNVSTAVSIILSALGYNVVKHGNVAISGKVGSADILELLGIPIKLTVEEMQEFYEKNGFVFLLAPVFHPAMRNVAPIRKKLGVPTIFNLLGPLVNPANPEYQIIGVGDKTKLDVYAQAASKFTKKKFIIYSSYDGYDEVSTKEPTRYYKIIDGQISEFVLKPEDFFEPFEMPNVCSKEEAVKLFVDGISGKNEKVSILFAINTALALNLIENLSIDDGFEKTLEIIKSGKVLEKLESLKGVEV